MLTPTDRGRLAVLATVVQSAAIDESYRQAVVDAELRRLAAETIRDEENRAERQEGY